ncbi:MAG: hypothetical protein ACK4Z5_08595 [Brevundimonas sp.]
MSRVKIIGWTAFAVCLLGYGGAFAAAWLYRAEEITVAQALIFGAPAALVGEAGLWIAAGSLGWTLFKRRKALFDRVFGRRALAV